MNIDIADQYHKIMSMGINKTDIELRRLSKNQKRPSNTKFNEIFGYDQPQKKKPVPIERNKFNLKMNNVNVDVLGFKNYYDIGRNTSESPEKRRSISRRHHRMSMMNNFTNPLDAEEFIPKAKRLSVQKTEIKQETNGI